MRQPRRLFTFMVPGIWAATTAVGIRDPGDEYALWGVGALPGLWLPVLIGWGSLAHGLWLTLAAGMVVMSVPGATMDRLRIPWFPWYACWVIFAGLICTAEISSFPSWSRAMSKNGSFQAYALSSLNIGLMLSTAAAVAAAVAWRAVQRLIAVWTRRGP